MPSFDLASTAAWPFARSWYVRRLLWTAVEASAFRYSPPRANRFRTRLLRAFGATIAEGAVVRRTVKTRHPWLLSLGRNSAIGDGVRVYNLGAISIGDQTVVSQYTHLCAGTHDYRDPALPLRRPPICIGNSVWICADSFIGPGVTVGDRSVIGARSVVMADVPSDVVANGNPLQIMKQRTWR